MRPMAARRRHRPGIASSREVMKAAYAERLAGLGESEPLAAESCTTHLTACDAEGNVVAITTTLMSSFGSRVLLPQSGVLLNNGMMWFDPRPGTAELHRTGQAPAVQHAADHADGEWAALSGRRCIRRSADHGVGVPAHDLHRRFRHERGAGGASSADRRVERRQSQCGQQAAISRARCIGDGRTGGSRRAQRGADQFRLPECDRAVGGRHPHRHQ